MGLLVIPLNTYRNNYIKYIDETSEFFIHAKTLVKIFSLHYCSQTTGLEHVNSVNSPHCTASEAQKSFYLFGQLRQSP